MTCPLMFIPGLYDSKHFHLCSIRTREDIGGEKGGRMRGECSKPDSKRGGGQWKGDRILYV